MRHTEDEREATERNSREENHRDRYRGESHSRALFVLVRVVGIRSRREVRSQHLIQLSSEPVVLVRGQ